MWQSNKVTIGLCVVVAAVVMASNYHGAKEMSDLSQQTYLRLYGEGIYEYHALTGKWPSKTADLANTSLSRKYPHWWTAQLGINADVIAIPKDLKPQPQENGRVILVYHNKGLDAERGRMWVCWGDLRTECITAEELHAHLRANQE